MIRSIFFPDRIGSYVLFKKRIVAIEITDTYLEATLISLSGKKKSIDAHYEIPLSSDVHVPYDQKIIQAIESLRNSLGEYDLLYYVMPSARVIFKELSLPLVGLRKIKMVVPFEAEPLLPFSLEDGVLDCIITQQEEAKTDLMIGAVKKEYLEKIVSSCSQARVSLEKVTVDIFDLYTLYLEFSKNTPKKEVMVLLDIGHSRTILGILLEDRLAYVRSFSRGCLSSQEHLESSTYDTKQLQELLAEIRLTLDIALSNLGKEKDGTELVVSGKITDFKESQDSLSEQLNALVTFLTPKELIAAGLFSSSLSTITGAALVSIAAAASCERTEDFTLLQEQEEKEFTRTLFYQIVAGALLTVTIFLSFSLYSFFRIRTLKNSHISAEKEAIGELQKLFKLPPSKTTKLELANKAAQADLKKQETAWKRIAPENRYSSLRYLSELTKCINMKESQLELTHLIIKDDTIKLYGSVPGYPQLNKLQLQLECPLFKRVPKLQDRNFKTEPITLIVNEENL